MKYKSQAGKGKPKTMQDYASNQVRKLDYPHYVMTLFAPRDKQAALWALYSFNIELARIRGLVTEPIMGLIRIQWWREAIEKLYKGEVLRQETLQALDENKNLFQEKDLQKLIDAYETDLRKQSFDSEQDYISHADTMGTALLQIICKIWGNQIPELLLKVIATGEYIVRSLEKDTRCINLDKDSIRNSVLQKINFVDRCVIKKSAAFLCYNFIKWQLKYIIRQKKPNEAMLGFYLWRKSIGF